MNPVGVPLRRDGNDLEAMDGRGDVHQRHIAFVVTDSCVEVWVCDVRVWVELLVVRQAGCVIGVRAPATVLLPPNPSHVKPSRKK